MFRRVVLLASAAMLASVASTAEAAVLTYEFSGLIDSSSDFSGGNVYNGQAFSGRISYDDNLTPSDIYPGGQKFYRNAVNIDMSSPIGSYSGTGYINHYSTNTVDDILVFAGFGSGGLSLVNLTTYLSYTADKPLPTDLSGKTVSVTAEGRDALGFVRSFNGTTKFTVPVTSAVPEPATWAMMIVGFGVVGASMRRRKQVSTARFA